MPLAHPQDHCDWAPRGRMATTVTFKVAPEALDGTSWTPTKTFWEAPPLLPSTPEPDPGPTPWGLRDCRATQVAPFMILHIMLH